MPARAVALPALQLESRLPPDAVASEEVLPFCDDEPPEDVAQRVRGVFAEADAATGLTDGLPPDTLFLDIQGPAGALRPRGDERRPWPLFLFANALLLRPACDSPPRRPTGRRRLLLRGADQPPRLPRGGRRPPRPPWGPAPAPGRVRRGSLAPPRG